MEANRDSHHPAVSASQTPLMHTTHAHYPCIPPMHTTYKYTITYLPSLSCPYITFQHVWPASHHPYTQSFNVQLLSSNLTPQHYHCSSQHQNLIRIPCHTFFHSRFFVIFWRRLYMHTLPQSSCICTYLPCTQRQPLPVNCQHNASPGLHGVSKSVTQCVHIIATQNASRHE